MTFVKAPENSRKEKIVGFVAHLQVSNKSQFMELGGQRKKVGQAASQHPQERKKKVEEKMGGLPREISWILHGQ